MKRLTPVRAIRLKCLDCSAGSSNEVKLCLIEDCPLYKYRFGKNPARKGLGGLGNAEALKEARRVRQDSQK